jgi:hypothetical protein
MVRQKLNNKVYLFIIILKKAVFTFFALFLMIQKFSFFSPQRLTLLNAINV